MKRAGIIIGKVFLNIFIVLLCILLFVSTLATMLVADLQVAIDPKNLANAIKNTLSAPTYTQLGPVCAAAGGGLDFSSGNISGQLVELAYDVLAEQSGGDLPITLDQAKDFVENSTVKDFIADKSASILNDLVTGENNTTFTTAEVKTLLQENKGVIKQYFNVELTDEQIDTVTAAIDEIPMIQQIQAEGITNVLANAGAASPDADPDTTDANGDPIPVQPSTSSNPLTEILGIVRTFTTTPILLGCIGVCLVLLGLIFLCSWSKPYKALIAGGIPVLLAGLVFLVPTMVATFAAATWLSLLGSVEMAGPLSLFVLKLVAPVCITVTVLGVLMIAGGIVLGCIMRKNRKAKAAALASPILEEAPAAEEAPAVEEASAMEEVPAAEEAPAEEPVAEEVPAE